jgi:hypothetical protein
MTGMQIAHSGYERNALAFASPLLHALTQVAGTNDRFHDR